MGGAIEKQADLAETARAQVNAMISHMSEDPDWNGFDTAMLKNIELEEVDIERKVVVFTMTVDESLCNKLGNLHGGAASLIMDCITSFAVPTISREGFWENSGVTRSLSLSFLRPVPIGTKIRLEGEVIHAGKSLANLVGRIKRFSDGEVCVTCVHDKVAISIPKL